MNSFNRQRGGRASPRSWLVIAVCLAGLASAALNVYQFKHPRIVIYLLHPESGEPQKEKASSGALHGDGSCDLSWSGCWKTAQFAPPPVRMSIRSALARKGL